MDVHITQFNVQLYFKQPLLDNNAGLSKAFEQPGKPASLQVPSVNGPEQQNYSHPMRNSLSFFREGFKIAPVQSNVLPFRILQVMSYPNVLAEADSETVKCLDFVSTSLKRHMDIDVEKDVYAVRVVYHSIVTGSPELEMVLSQIESLEDVPSLAGKYVGHKNPMDAIQLTLKTEHGLSQPFWNDIRISQFKSNSYVVTIFNETDSLPSAVDFIKCTKAFVSNFMQEIESAVMASATAAKTGP